MQRRTRVLAALSLLLVPVAIACGSDGDGSDFGNGNGSSGSSGNGSSGSSGNGTFVSDDASTSSDGSTTGDGAACNAPVDMFIMFDRSKSMGSDCTIGSNTDSKWCRSINALSGYFSSNGAANQAAALQFFPLDSHTDQLCSTGSKYDVPALPTGTPPFTGLPSTSFDALLNSTKPGGDGTPTEAAIRGLTSFTAANRRGGRVTIGILITDGDPNGCDEDLDNLSSLLQAHYAATQIRTYVIGMEGASFDNLEKISKGGNAPEHADTVGTVADACGDGNGPCHHWNVGNGDPAVFAAALAAIQASADGCAPGGGHVNPVN